MPAVALLVFREVLEAALIVAVVCAATRGVPHRGAFVAGGIGVGAAGAVLVALGAGFIADLASGAGQNLFNAGVLLAAVAMIGWHVVWMSSHGRELTQKMQALGGAVKTGASSLRVLFAVVALAVLREGSEIVLFLYGMAAGGVGAAGEAAGIALGVGGGALLGVALYFGLLRIPLKHFFGVTNGLLMLLAAGLAATAAGFLVESGWLPAWGGQLWNTSRLVADDSLAGRTLGILIGYKARPEGIQVAFYLATLVALVALVALARRGLVRGSGARGAIAGGATVPAVAAAAVGIMLIAAARPAAADDFVVYSPYVTATQNEIEVRGYRVEDARAGLRAAAAAELSISRGMNAWWQPEIYLVRYQRSAGSGGLQGYEFENTLQLTPPGKYPADLGFLASYEHNTAARTSDAVEFGPLLAIKAGRFAHTVNLIWEKEVGAGAGRGYEFRYSYAATYAISSRLRPGVEAYGRPADRAYQAGPILAGEWHLPRTFSSLEYRVGVVLGLNAAAPRLTSLARLEYEFF